MNLHGQVLFRRGWQDGKQFIWSLRAEHPQEYSIGLLITISAGSSRI